MDATARPAALRPGKYLLWESQVFIEIVNIATRNRPEIKLKFTPDVCCPVWNVQATNQGWTVCYRLGDKNLQGKLIKREAQ